MNLKIILPVAHSDGAFQKENTGKILVGNKASERPQLTKPRCLIYSILRASR